LKFTSKEKTQALPKPILLGFTAFWAAFLRIESFRKQTKTGRVPKMKLSGIGLFIPHFE
jgi:hypothetical protein